jgi:hypothetical protein
VLAAVCGGHLALDAYARRHLDHYRDDRAFLESACSTVPAGQPILVNGESEMLCGSWWLYYGHGRTRLIHNLTFLLDDRLDPDEVYLILRRRLEPALATYGAAELLVESRHSKHEITPADRYALYRLRFRPDLARRPADVRFTPLQAAVRVPGPYLR